MRYFTVIKNSLSSAGLMLCCTIHTIDTTFHLKNNSTSPIQIDIAQGQWSLTNLKRIAQGGDFAFRLDINKPTTIDIYRCPTADFCKTNAPEKLTATFKAGKTIYIKFDGKTIKPQKGNPITNETTVGYSTKNNVTGHDISVTRTQPAPLKTGTAHSVREELKKKPVTPVTVQEEPEGRSKKEELITLLKNPPDFLDNFTYELLTKITKTYDTQTLESIKTKILEWPLTNFGPAQKTWKKKIIAVIDSELKNM